MNKMTRIIGPFLMLLTLGSTPPAHAGVIAVLKTTGVDGQIAEINPSTGAIVNTLVPSLVAAGLGSWSVVSGLTLAEGGTSLLYVSENFSVGSGTFDARLARIDPLTGAVLSTHALASSQGSRGGLSYQSPLPGDPSIITDIIYYMDGSNGTQNNPLHVNHTFGGVSSFVEQQLHPFGVGALGGDDNGRHFLFDLSPSGNGRILEFVTQPNLTVSVVNDLGPTAAPFFTGPSGLAFDGTSLFASDDSGNLFTLNPDTGALLNTVDVGSNISALAATPSSSPVPSPVPEPGTFGLLALGLAGLLRFRRRLH